VCHQEGRAREEKLAGAGEEGLERRERTATSPWLQTGVKARVRELRESLSAEEQTILVLRVDRGMAWSDVARVIGGPDQDAHSNLSARSAALRQRFHTIKERLRALVQEDGLLGAGT